MRLGRRRAGGSSTVARFVAWFVVAGIVAVLIAGVASWFAGQQAGEREAIADLHTQTRGVAQLRIQPAVTNALLEGNITAVGEMGAAVRHYVLDQSVARVKIWNEDGTIVYSDEARLIGTNKPPSPDEIAVLGSNAVRSKISDPSEPENRFEGAEGKLLEVDLRLQAPNGKPLRLEVFYRYNAVTEAGTDVWKRFAPYTLGVLAALAAVLIFVGSVLARRLRTSPSEPRPEPAPPDEPVVSTAFIAEPAGEPDPGSELFVALARLLARPNGAGIPSTLDTEHVHDTIPPGVADLLFRATQEALRNHDGTTPVTVRVSDRDHVATVDIIEHAGNGHADLRALTDIVADAGGRLLVDAAENGGTRVHVEVPLPDVSK